MNSSLWSRRRGFLAITVAILKAAAKGVRKTHLLYSVGLSYEQLCKYLHFLRANGLIERRGEFFKTTVKGLELVGEFEASKLMRSIVST